MRARCPRSHCERVTAAKAAEEAGLHRRRRCHVVVLGLSLLRRRAGALVAIAGLSEDDTHSHDRPSSFVPASTFAPEALAMTISGCESGPPQHLG